MKLVVPPVPGAVSLSSLNVGSTFRYDRGGPVFMVTSASDALGPLHQVVRLVDGIRFIYQRTDMVYPCDLVAVEGYRSDDNS